MTIPGQSAKLNVRQSVFVAKSPNIMSAECTSIMSECKSVIYYICVYTCVGGQVGWVCSACVHKL